MSKKLEMKTIFSWFNITEGKAEEIKVSFIFDDYHVNVRKKLVDIISAETEKKISKEKESDLLQKTGRKSVDEVIIILLAVIELRRKFSNRKNLPNPIFSADLIAGVCEIVESDLDLAMVTTQLLYSESFTCRNCS